MKVFVYGTLKAGRANHHVMERAKGRLISKATLRDFGMYSLVAFPAITPLVGGTVRGELYEVEDIAPLDWLEGYRGPGHGNFYNRETVKVLAGDDEHEAWTYTLQVDQSRYALMEEW